MRANARIFPFGLYRRKTPDDRAPSSVFSQLRRHRQCDAVNDGVPSGAGRIQLSPDRLGDVVDEYSDAVLARIDHVVGGS